MRHRLSFESLPALTLIMALATAGAAQAASVKDKYQARISERSKAMYLQIYRHL